MLIFYYVRGNKPIDKYSLKLLLNIYIYIFSFFNINKKYYLTNKL